MSEWTHTQQVTLPAARERVFAALTTPSELERWFAEQVEIDPCEGGVFRPWGRHTYGAPARSTSGGAIAVFAPGKTLAYDWIFDGVPSRVTLTLDADSKDESKTKLALTHTFERRSGISYEKELVDDLWRLTLGNLDAHLRGGAGIVLPDFTNPDPEIRLSIVINAPKEKVFRALTDPAALARWFALKTSKPPVVEPRPGGRYDIGWEYEIGGRMVKAGTSRILDFVENERLVTDWLNWRGDDTRRPHRLAWLLETAGTGTKVTLIHGGFERPADISDYPFGWPYFLDTLKKDVEGTA